MNETRLSRVAQPHPLFALEISRSNSEVSLVSIAFLRSPMVFCVAAFLPFLAGNYVANAGEVVSVEPLFKTVRAVGPKGAGHQPAMEAWKELAKADADQLPEILAGMDQAGPLAMNWLRAAVETIVQRQTDAGESLPQPALEQFLADAKHAPRSRRLAYELIARVDPTAPSRLIPTMLNDSSLELRREAVARVLKKAAALAESGDKAAAIESYQRAFAAARDLDQVKQARGALEKLGEKVDLQRHFGFLAQWKLIGPFDNTGTKGFDVAYGPEEKKVDFSATYEGKLGPVHWIDATTEDPFGQVDLNKALGTRKGVVAYAVAEFYSDREQPVELRLGSVNGNKAWLNGKLLFANHVYHANTQMDQYVGHGKLKPGRNEILLKICQNEQTDSWAEAWRFQLRVCDRIGTAVLSQTPSKSSR